jgi:hypothetical protein
LHFAFNPHFGCNNIHIGVPLLYDTFNSLAFICRSLLFVCHVCLSFMYYVCFVLVFSPYSPSPFLHQSCSLPPSPAHSHPVLLTPTHFCSLLVALTPAKMKTSLFLALCCIILVPSKYQFCITSHHITSHHITSHHITSHHITSHHITSHHITSHRIASYRIALRSITSHHIMMVCVGKGGKDSREDKRRCRQGGRAWWNLVSNDFCRGH